MEKRVQDYSKEILRSSAATPLRLLWEEGCRIIMRMTWQM